MPELYLFEGCNGAGKTTVALKLLPALGCRNFVNADLLARGLAPLGGDVDFQAGVLMMRRLRALREAGEDFGTESTLAARAFVPFIRDCRARGYRFSSASLRAGTGTRLPRAWLPIPPVLPVAALGWHGHSTRCGAGAGRRAPCRAGDRAPPL